MKAFAERKPYWFVVLIFAAESLLAIPFVALSKVFGFGIEPLRLIIPIAQSVLVIWVLWRLGWLRQVGFHSKVVNVHLLWLPLVVAFVPVLLFGSIEIAAQGVLFYTLAVLFTGLSEEGLARGIILRTLLPKGLWVALLGAGALFSVGHLSNLAFADFDVLAMAEVLLNTFGFAILYGAVFLRTLNIWPLIVLHTIEDFIYVISGTAGPYMNVPLPTNLHILIAVCSIAYGLYLVRNVKPDAILEKMKQA